MFGLVQKTSYKRLILKVSLGISFLLFAWSIFGNLQYPLLWNDEAECAMHAQRVLEYGTPKVDDGKNIVYPLRLHDKQFAIDEHGNYTGIGWGMFYYGALAVKLSELSEDLYVRTWLMRMPFALLGIIGVCILMVAFARLFANIDQRMLFATLCFLFMTVHVDIGLHLREVRYYSLVVFFGGILFYLILHHSTSRMFNWFFPLGAFLLYLCFPPMALILIASYIAWLFVEAGFRPSWNRFIAPGIAALLVLFPYMYFQSWQYAQLSNEFYGFNLKVYLVHIRELGYYFLKYSYGAELLLVVTLLVFLKLSRFRDRFGKTWLFLVGFGVIYILVIALIPHFVFTRYFVFLSILVCLVLSLFFTLVLNKIKRSYLLGMIALVLLVFTVKRGEDIYGKMYELSHQYKGPLDYEIPFIKEKYGQTDTLIIATNYEETAYMFYLDAKVIMGFVLNNLKEDIQERPDIIIFRHDWAWNYEKSKFAPFFEQANYSKKEFEVYDYPYNNIPELNLKDGGHLYETRIAQEEEIKAHLYLLQR